jgi:hypothetical protein
MTLTQANNKLARTSFRIEECARLASEARTYMVLDAGRQWGRGPRDADGASGETFSSVDDAYWQLWLRTRAGE